MTGWQPIDSAPKDGTIVILFSTRDGIGVGKWVEQKYDRWEMVDEDTQRRVGVDDYSRFEGVGCSETCAVCIHGPACTHWMPLPQPPVSA